MSNIFDRLFREHYKTQEEAKADKIKDKVKIVKNDIAGKFKRFLPEGERCITVGADPDIMAHIIRKYSNLTIEEKPWPRNDVAWYTVCYKN
jgi:hypothetical protein